jgi:hypothetical protein
LVHLVVGDLSDGGERLQGRAIWIVGLRRIEDDPVVLRHLAQHVRFPVIGLSEAAGHAALHVTPADRVDPVRHGSHVKSGGRQSALVIHSGEFIHRRGAGPETRRAAGT